jgi:hypothetical protein
MGEVELKRKKSLGEQIVMPCTQLCTRFQTLNVNQKKKDDEVKKWSCNLFEIFS